MRKGTGSQGGTGEDTVSRASVPTAIASEGVADLAIGHQLGQMILETRDPPPFPAASIAQVVAATL
jgi:hypothetical protein